MRFAILVAALLTAGSSLAAERTVTDAAGRTVSIPEQPQRIVVMHEPLLGVPLMDLGANVVGAYGRNSDGKFATAVDFIDTVLGEGRTKPKGFGAVGQIDLEKLRALQPDLIVATEMDSGKAEQLSTVAPVYLQKVSTGHTYGFSVEENLSGLVGRSDAFAERRKTYDEKLATVKKALGEDAKGKTYLAILLTDQINAVGDMSGAVQALEDLGYARLKIDNATSSGGLGSTLAMPLSAEGFGKLNPDLLVVMNSYNSPARGEAGTRAALEKIIPGWERFVKPARDGRIVFLDSSRVTTPSIPSALHTLDAVESWAGRR